MKKITFLFTFCLTFAFTNAQTINFNAGDTWSGFMNVYELPANGGAFQFGSGWGIPDLVAIPDIGNNNVELKPNRITDPDPYWQTGNLKGNKDMEASFYVDNNALATSAFTWNGSVSSRTLIDPDFTAQAFIKIYNGDYSTVLYETYSDLTAGDFTISYDGATGGAIHAQYGFIVRGPNINFASTFDAGYAALGSVIVTEQVLSVNQFELAEFLVFPNPTQNIWTIRSNQEILNIQVYDVLGKEVISLNPLASEMIIDGTQLSNGIYFAKINSLQGNTIKRLVKE